MDQNVAVGHVVKRVAMRVRNTHDADRVLGPRQCVRVWNREHLNLQGHSGGRDHYYDNDETMNRTVIPRLNLNVRYILPASIGV